jgi:hypothetical protein
MGARSRRIFQGKPESDGKMNKKNTPRIVDFLPACLTLSQSSQILYLS